RVATSQGPARQPARVGDVGGHPPHLCDQSAGFQENRLLAGSVLGLRPNLFRSSESNRPPAPRFRLSTSSCLAELQPTADDLRKLCVEFSAGFGYANARSGLLP